MIIKFSPSRGDATLTVEKAGDALTINGEVFDFSVIPEGATLPETGVPSEFVRGDVARVDGVLSLTLWLPYGPTPLGYHFDPEPLIDPADGVLVLPAPPAPIVEGSDPIPDLPLAPEPAPAEPEVIDEQP